MRIHILSKPIYSTIRLKLSPLADAQRWAILSTQPPDMKQQKRTTGISTAWMVVAVATAALSYAGPQLLDALQAASQPPSPLKPYADLRAFRPR